MDNRPRQKPACGYPCQNPTTDEFYVAQNPSGARYSTTQDARTFRSPGQFYDENYAHPSPIRNAHDVSYGNRVEDQSSIPDMNSSYFNRSNNTRPNSRNANEAEMNSVYFDANTVGTPRRPAPYNYDYYNCPGQYYPSCPSTRANNPTTDCNAFSFTEYKSLYDESVGNMNSGYLDRNIASLRTAQCSPVPIPVPLPIPVPVPTSDTRHPLPSATSYRSKMPNTGDKGLGNMNPGYSDMVLRRASEAINGNGSGGPASTRKNLTSVPDPIDFSRGGTTRAPNFDIRSNIRNNTERPVSRDKPCLLVDCGYYTPPQDNKDPDTPSVESTDNKYANSNTDSAVASNMIAEFLGRTTDICKQNCDQTCKQVHDESLCLLNCMYFEEANVYDRANCTSTKPPRTNFVSAVSDESIGEGPSSPPSGPSINHSAGVSTISNDQSQESQTDKKYKSKIPQAKSTATKKDTSSKKGMVKIKKPPPDPQDPKEPKEPKTKEEAEKKLEETKQDSINMLSVTISTVMLLAAGIKNIPKNYISWSYKYLKCIKNCQGHHPANIKKFLKMLGGSDSDVSKPGDNLCLCPFNPNSA